MIYQIDLDMIDDGLEALLSGALQDKTEYKRYYHRQNQIEHLCSATIPKALGSALGYYTQGDIVSRGRFGKPYVASSAYAFNVSHSGKYMVVVYNTKAV